MAAWTGWTAAEIATAARLRLECEPQPDCPVIREIAVDSRRPSMAKDTLFVALLMPQNAQAIKPYPTCVCR